MWQTYLAKLEVLNFLLRNCVGTLRAAADSRFSFINSVLDLRCTRGLSSSSSETTARSGVEQEIHHHHLHQILVSELEMLIFL